MSFIEDLKQVFLNDDDTTRKTYSVEKVSYLVKLFIDDQICLKELNKRVGFDFIYSIPEEFLNSEEKMKLLIEICPDSFRVAANNVKSNKEIALLAISKKGRLYNYVKNLEDDIDIIWATIMNDGSMIDSIPEKFLENELLIMEAIKNNKEAMERVPRKFRENEKLMEFAVEHGYNYSGYPFLFKKNKKLVLKALENKPSFYKEIDSSLKKDIDVVNKILESEVGWEILGKKSIITKDMIVKAINNKLDILGYIDKKYYDDEDLMKFAVEKEIVNIQYLSSGLIEKKKLIQLALKKDVNDLKYLSNILSDNKIDLLLDEETILLAYKNNIRNIKYINNWENNFDLILKLVKIDSECLNYLNTQLLDSNLLEKIYKEQNFIVWLLNNDYEENDKIIEIVEKIERKEDLQNNMEIKEDIKKLKRKI